MTLEGRLSWAASHQPQDSDWSLSGGSSSFPVSDTLVSCGWAGNICLSSLSSWDKSHFWVLTLVFSCSLSSPSASDSSLEKGEEEEEEGGYLRGCRNRMITNSIYLKRVLIHFSLSHLFSLRSHSSHKLKNSLPAAAAAAYILETVAGAAADGVFGDTASDEIFTCGKIKSYFWGIEGAPKSEREGNVRLGR